MYENEIRIHKTYRRSVVLIDKRGVKYIITSLNTGGLQIFTKEFKHELFSGTTNGIVKGKSFCIGLYKDVKNPETIKTLEI